MAFFPIARYINRGLIPQSGLKDDFFDYVLHGDGSLDDVCNRAQITPQVLLDLRREFLFWYPLDINFGGKEHWQVHFPFFIFHHSVMFDESLWPKGIFVNWHLIVNGQKMSKHLGNVIQLDHALDVWGTDSVRLYIVYGSNQWQDFDWRDSECQSYKAKLESFVGIVEGLLQPTGEEESSLGNWLQSKMSERITEVTEALERGEVRRALDSALFGIWQDLKWFKRRTNSQVEKKWVRDWLTLLSPFLPRTCEMLLSSMGPYDSVQALSWPNPGKIDTESLRFEERLAKTIEDLNHIQRLTGRTKLACIYVVKDHEQEQITAAKRFIENETGISEVRAYSISDINKYDPQGRAKKATIDRPAFYLE
jgi:leucyl-tRNA synthetase